MRNIMLFIDNVAEARGLAKKALKIARQCQANLLLCDLVTNRVKEELLVSHYDDDDVLSYENDGMDVEDLVRQLKLMEPEGSFTPMIDSLEISNFNLAIVNEIVISRSIWLIIVEEQQLSHLKNV